MSAQASDHIYRLHPDHQQTLDPSKLVHLCAAVHSPFHFCAGVHSPEGGGVSFRDQLDPRATGLCAYCGEPLPIPAPVQAKPMRGPVTSEE
jgi:hypothetical protein